MGRGGGIDYRKILYRTSGNRTCIHTAHKAGCAVIDLGRKGYIGRGAVLDDKSCARGISYKAGGELAAGDGGAGNGYVLESRSVNILEKGYSVLVAALGDAAEGEV